MASQKEKQDNCHDSTSSAAVSYLLLLLSIAELNKLILSNFWDEHNLSDYRSTIKNTITSTVYVTVDSLSKHCAKVFEQMVCLSILCSTERQLTKSSFSRLIGVLPTIKHNESNARRRIWGEKLVVLAEWPCPLSRALNGTWNVDASRGESSRKIQTLSPDFRFFLPMISGVDCDTFWVFPICQLKKLSLPKASQPSLYFL